MFRLFSKGCEYALRGLMYFPTEPDIFVRVEQISKEAHIPEHFTRKMFQMLVQKEILIAVPGPNGGYKLARSPEKISLLEIIDIIDGVEAMNECVLGLSICDDQSPCAVHGIWSEAKKNLIPKFREESVADLLKSSKRDHLLRLKRPALNSRH